MSTLQGVQRTARPATANGQCDVLLVCSPGGHLLQLLALQPAWRDFNRAWVTLARSDALSLLASERVYYGYGPTNRSLVNLVRNLVLSLSLLARLRPRVIVTTGAGIAVPFAWLAPLFGARVVYIESLTRINSPSLSLRLIAPVADRIYTQWPELALVMKRARFVGQVFSGT